MTTTPAFHPVLPEDEYLHPPANDTFTAVETNFFGCNVPEADLDIHLYFWYRPGIGIMSVDFYAFRGLRETQLSADYHTHHAIIPMSPSIDDHTVTVGTCTIRVRVIDPLREILIDIKDPRADLAVTWRTTAALEPVGRPGGGHFTQLMANEGTFRLRGEEHRISGHFIRDRSYGYTRTEDSQVGPPYNWITGWWGDQQAFHAAILDTSVFDSPEFGPGWDQHENVTGTHDTMIWEDQSHTQTPTLNLRYGWWSENGVTYGLTDADLTTHLAPGTVRPVGATLTLTDERGSVHRLTGRVISQVPHFAIFNNDNRVSFMEWTDGDRHGLGNLTIVYTNEHLWGDRWTSSTELT